MPTGVELPAETWVAGYAKEIESLPGVLQRTANEALDVVSALLEPLPNDTALTGTWDPERTIWNP